MYIVTFICFISRLKCKVDPPILVLVIFYVFYFSSNVAVWIVLYSQYGFFKAGSQGLDLREQQLISPYFIMAEDVMVFVIIIFLQFFIYEMLLVKIVFDCQTHSTYEYLIKRAKCQRLTIFLTLGSLLLIGIVIQLVKMANPRMDT